MDRQKIQEELRKSQTILDALDQKILAAEKDLQAREEIYVASVIKEEAGQRITGMETQLSRQSDAQNRLNALIKAKSRTEEDLKALEKDLELVDLFDQHGQGFHSAMATCEQSIQAIEQSGSLNEHIKGLVGAIASLFHEVEEAVGNIKAINTLLDERYALGPFLDGELVLGQEDRDVVLEEIGQKLKTFTRTSLSVDLKAVQQLVDLIPLFSEWQRMISGYATGRDLTLSRRSLIPKKPKAPANRQAHPMGRAFYADIEAHPERYAPRDIQWMKRAMGLNPDEPSGGKITTLGGC